MSNNQSSPKTMLELIAERAKVINDLEDRKEREKLRAEKLTKLGRYTDVNAPKYKERYTER